MAKSGNDWGMNELFAFNIEVIHEEPQQFFGCPLPEVLEFIIPYLVVHAYLIIATSQFTFL